MDKKLLDILVCPNCKKAVAYHKDEHCEELRCRPCGVAYPIRDQVPIMLIDQARTLEVDERLT